MQPILTLTALYNYDPTLFDGMLLPTGVDKDIFIENLIGETYELEVIYPDAEIMKSMITRWSNTMINEWRRLDEALGAEYSSLGAESREREIHNLTLESLGGSNGTSDHSVAGFNSNNADNLVPSANDSSRLTSNTSTTDTGELTREKRLTGVIGGLTTADLLEREVKFRSNYDIYSIIINNFKQRFCLMVY